MNVAAALAAALILGVVLAAGVLALTSAVRLHLLRRRRQPRRGR